MKILSPQHSVRIVYVTTARLPTEKAHGLATVKLCDALAAEGREIELVIPKGKGSSESIFSSYGVSRRFPVVKIFTINFVPFGIFLRFAFFLKIFSFSIAATFFLIWKYRKKLNSVIFFSHDSLPLFFLSLFTKNIFYDIHHFPEKNFFYRYLLKRVMGVGVQTIWKVNALREAFNLDEGRIVAWPNGTDLRDFRNLPSREEARKMLVLAVDRKIALYAGQLFIWKGVDTFIRSISFLPGNVHIYIVGGDERDVRHLQDSVEETRNPRVHFLPFQPHSRIPIWLTAADVLVLPNTGKMKVSNYYTSPMKLFEYMASGVPIVASRIPSILEILNEGNAFLAEADNPKSFAEKISEAMHDTSEASSRGRRALHEVQKFTWEERAKRISDFLEGEFR